ncbi:MULTISPECIES: 5-(carboxyamino)imidazole ribonucleotide synthase [Gammaproteobacteria]|uniref:5-(carboxyamino)imidazole ribonucleotide synthase n=1 Tax=Gammaproteobacteria TaxID=1236 RepID=UPI000DCFAE87|nr:MULTISPECIES: 5-(carboxyamino)imidazole ribonucleotide synthase [Gammaproteobacteria]RTE86549.1 5-(carboxyamino)imidazole ribonucleotide synthase [Aliidiomarina sp. B3213]TCZ90896.1 5-(carboxyamino)imidazole ribonucleotide synthase [Lysobacter sp. N42]
MKTLILGNGQLGQMLGQAAVQLGDEVLLVNTKTNEVMPVGAHQAVSLTLEQAVEWADVVTWEHEQISPQHIALAKHKFLTDPNAIQPLTHRRHEKQMCDDLSIATSPWKSFNTAEELADILASWETGAVIKAAEGGYDGKGQWRWKPGQDIDSLLATAGQQPGIVEAFIPFNYEVSIVGARTQNGSIHCYPLVQNVHREGILSHTFAGLVDIPTHLQPTAEQWFQKLTEHLGYVGTLAIEFFVVGEGENAELLVNEIAPRVHNSGHWSMVGSNCSQFSLHMRCMAQHTIPELTMAPTMMLNIIGAEKIADSLWAIPTSQPFWYGKAPRPGRKVGHVNFSVTSLQQAEELVSQYFETHQLLA